MPVEPIELVFPLRGIDDGWSFSRQPEGTCPDASNVIPYDIIDSRARGGQRWGLSKYYTSLHNGATALQRMTSIAQATVGVNISDVFTQSNGALSTTNWYLMKMVTHPNWTADTNHPYVSGNAIVHDNTTASGITYRVGCLHKSAFIEDTDYELTANVTLARHGGVGSLVAAGFVVRSVYPSFPISILTEQLAAYVSFSATTVTLYIAGTFETVPIGSSGDWKDPTYWTGGRTLKLVVSGDEFSLYADGVQMAGDTVSTVTNTALRGNLYLGLYIQKGNTANDSITIDDFTFISTASQSRRKYRILAISGGDVFSGVPWGSLHAAVSGTNALVTSGPIDAQPSFGKVYFADGDPAHYKLWTYLDDTVSTWTPTDGTLPMGSSQTAVTITAATSGTPSFTVGEDWSARAAGNYLLVAGSTANDGYYTVVSTSGTGPTVITVAETMGDDTADGTIQYQDQACQIIKLYRGRIVMAGLTSEPHNWFMAAVADPLDWDYGATSSATMAVAGNSTDAGECPDIITCLAPYSDDKMFIGGDHTLWLMQGDPADRGRIDNISYQIGISGPDAFAFDPNGIFYFFGMGTVWRMADGGVPEPLSRNRMDATFKAIDLTINTVHLAWDNVRHGLFIFVIPKTEGATTHYYWDERTDGFWKIVFPNAQGPTTVLTFDGDDPDDTAVILGGFDGYLRQIDPSVKDDDGTAVSSYILYPPISRGGSLKNTRLNGITAVLDANSDAVVLTTYAEDTIQGAIESSTIRSARSVSAGRTRILNRIAGNAIMIKLSNSIDEKAWAIESLVAEVEVIGRTRKNQL